VAAVAVRLDLQFNLLFLVLVEQAVAVLVVEMQTQPMEQIILAAVAVVQVEQT
jgi:hypothetical protein